MVTILVLVGVMFFSPLASQFFDDGLGRGGAWDMEIDELLVNGQTERALSVVDSLICVKSEGLPRFSYFDRYLSEEERDDAMTARVDIYDLQWRRIEILKIMGRIGPLRKALEDYTDIIGYNQDAAKDMLKQLNGE